MHPSDTSRYLLAITLLLVGISITSCVSIREKAPTNSGNNIAYSLNAECLPPDNPFSGNCSFSISDNTFSIDSSGKVVRTSRDGAQTAFTLPLNEHDFLEDIQYLDYMNDIILIYGVSDGDYGGGTVARLDGSSYSVKWATPIYGFNLSVGAVEDNYLYQAAIGFVSKINLDSGSFQWKHSGLYNAATSDFNDFEPPIVADDYVLFRSVNHWTKRIRTIRADKISGKFTTE